MRINFFPRQRAAKRSPHSYTAEGGSAGGLCQGGSAGGSRGHRKVGLAVLGDSGAGAGAYKCFFSFSFFRGMKPGEVGAGCLFVFLFNSWSF